MKGWLLMWGAGCEALGSHVLLAKDDETKLLEDTRRPKKLLTEKDGQNQKRDEEAQRLEEKDEQVLATDEQEEKGQEENEREGRGDGAAAGAGQVALAEGVPEV